MQDPGNLEADIQAGAQTGFALLWWFALVSLGCGTAFQVGAALRDSSAGRCCAARQQRRQVLRPAATWPLPRLWPAAQHAPRPPSPHPPPPPPPTHPQCLSGRVGLVTGKDIAQHCGEQWPRPARWLLWLLLEFSIVAVDIQETVGCAQGLYMLSQGQVPLWAGEPHACGQGSVMPCHTRGGGQWGCSLAERSGQLSSCYFQVHLV